MKKKYIILSLFFISLNLFGQVNEKWIARYNSPFDRNEEGHVVRVDDSGNVYVCGVSSISSTNSVCLTVKYDSLGNILWNRIYDYSENNDDYANSMELDGNGNIYISGSNQGIGTSLDFFLIKYRPNGDSIWIRRFNGAGNSNDFAHSLKVDNSNNIIVTGSTSNFSQGDFLTLKYDSNGVLLWNKTYNAPDNLSETANFISIDNTNNIYISGISNGSGTGQDFCIIKYNSNGDQQWMQRYNGMSNQDDRLYAMTVDRVGNVIVTGSTRDTLQDDKYCTIKYNSSGNQLWLRKFDRNYYLNFASSVQTDSLNNIYVTGATVSYSSKMDISTIKYTPSGDSIWVRTFNQTDNIYPSSYSMILDETGNPYITGTTTPTGNGSEMNYLTLKYNTTGEFQWFKIYNGSGNQMDQSTSICLDKKKNVYVTGLSTNANTSGWPFDFLTIKYSQTNPFIKVNLKILIEGIYFNLLNKMLRRDTVQLFLRDAIIPYAIRDSAKTVLDSNYFSGLLTFSNVPSGNYYLVVKHFSSVETWSKSGGESLISGFSTYNYDFTNSISNAYGNNLKLKGSKYCLYSGDINQDGFITLFDVIPIYNDAINYVTGRYIITDLTGDNIVDLTDVTLCYNNSTNFVRIRRP